MKSNSFLLLSKKRLFLVLVFLALAIIIHNIVSVLSGFEEPFFFIFSLFVIPLYLIFALIYSIAFFVKKRKGSKNETSYNN